MSSRSGQHEKATISHVQGIISQFFPKTVTNWTIEPWLTNIVATYEANGIKVCVTFCNTNGYGQCYSLSDENEEIVSGGFYISYQNVSKGSHQVSGLMPSLSAYFVKKGIEF